MGGRYRSAEERQAIDAEAARRFLEAHTANRPEVWEEVYRWVAEDPAHGVAFAKAEASWEVTERLRDVPLELEPEEVAGPAGHVEALLARRTVAAILLAVAVVGTLLAVAIQRFVAVDRYRTAIGEERIIQLADGSRVHLNTRSSIEVGLRTSRRTVRLLRGEARFDVSRDPARPFTVYSGGAEFRAVGTSFNVRLRPQLTELTVIQGSVIVRHGESPPKTVAANMGAAIRGGSIAVTSLAADQVARRLSWQAGVVRFSGTTLAQAVDEFNRYRKTPIIIGDAEIASLRVDGVYDIDASERFLLLLGEHLGVRAVRGFDRAVILLAPEENFASQTPNSRRLSPDR